MKALDSLPKELRQAVTEATYSCWDVRILAGQIAATPKQGRERAAAELAKMLKAEDEQLRKQRQR